MVKSYSRSERVAHLLQRELAQLIQQEIDDPGLPPLVTVSEVVMSADLAHAKIYITVLDDETRVGTALSVLNKAAPYLRAHLARNLKLRITPQLRFAYDASLVEGNRLAHLIDQANFSDIEQDADDK